LFQAKSQQQDFEAMYKNLSREHNRLASSGKYTTTFNQGQNNQGVYCLNQGQNRQLA
jgi:hypothetical protein